MGKEQKRRFVAAQRRQTVTELYLQGWSQTEIATHLDVAQSTISDDVQYVWRQWEQSSLRNFDQLRAREIQKLEYLEREAWAAWERSKKPSQSAVVTDQGTGNGQRTRKSLKHQVGDPRFLDQVNKSISQRRSLLGLDVLPAPSTDGFEQEVSLEVRRERVLTLIAAIGERERLGIAEEPPTTAEGE
jgi:transposase